MTLQEQCKKDFSYDPVTGILIKRATGLPGSSCGKGYQQFSWLGGKRYFVHRLVWLWNYGTFPSLDIDHINQDKRDNRLENLREVDRSTNLLNRKNRNDPLRNIVTGTRKGKPCYRVQLGYKKVQYYLGTYDNLIDAIITRDNWEETHHGRVQETNV